MEESVDLGETIDLAVDILEEQMCGDRGRFFLFQVSTILKSRAVLA